MSQTSFSRSSRLWLFIAGLGLAGLAITTYLTTNAILHSEIACSIDGCNTVLNSKWAKIFGVPASAYGMVTYSLIMLGALHAFQSPTNSLPGKIVTGISSAIGLVGSIYLTIIEIFVIKALCTYCITSASLVVVSAIATVVAARREGPLWSMAWRAVKTLK